LTRSRWREGALAAIPDGLALHWRVLWVALVVFAGVCCLSRFNISFRHFTVPLVLLILVLAPLPRLLKGLQPIASRFARLLGAASVALVLGSLFSALRAYPYYFPYLSPLALGRPAYALVNDSNLDWNQALPEVAAFAERRGLQQIKIDTYGFTDTAVVVPHSELWNCQEPAESDGDTWVAVSANMIMDGHNCVWLLQYPHEPLGGGSMYAVHLPTPVPPEGTAAGPPPPNQRRNFVGWPGGDMRLVFQKAYRFPERLPEVIAEMQEGFRRMQEEEAKSKGASPPP
jgi:hypothetical protein